MRGLTALLAACVILAGCASDGPDSTTSTSPDDPDTDSSSSSTATSTTSRVSTTGATTTNPVGNTAPTGTLAVNVPAGAVPLNVTFTLTGTDADNDPLSFTLDFDGDGTPDTNEASPATLPATVHHTYSAPGEFNVTYALSDGKTSVSYHALINATSGQAALTFTGHLTAPDPAAVAGQGCNVNAIVILGGPDNFGDNFDLPASAAGGAYTITPDGMRAEFWDTDFANYLGGGASGTVPDGAVIATTCGTSEAAVDVDYVLAIVPA